jgi:hypothetical protein
MPQTGVGFAYTLRLKRRLRRPTVEPGTTPERERLMDRGGGIYIGAGTLILIIILLIIFL